MARMIPANFPDQHPNDTRNLRAERKVFDLLKNAPGTEGWVVLHSVDFSDNRLDPRGLVRRKPESDFVLLIPDHGFVCLEVKGGEGRPKGRDYYQWDDMYATGEKPWEQAKLNFSIFLSNLEGTSLTDVHMFEAVLFPDITVDNKSRIPCAVFDRSHMQRKGRGIVNEIKNKFRNLMRRDHKRRPADLVDIAMLRERLMPTVERRYPILPVVEELNVLTGEQYSLLETVELNFKRHWVYLGGPGTGKTKMALACARKAKLWYPDYSIGILSSSIRASKYLQYKVASGNNGIEVIDCNNIMSTQSGSLDYLIIDDAHNLCVDHLLADINRIARHGIKGTPWIMFGDGNLRNGRVIFRNYQSGVADIDLTDAIAKYFNGDSPDIMRYILSTPCRNTIEIHEIAHSLSIETENLGQPQKFVRRYRPVQYQYWNNATELANLLDTEVNKLHDDVPEIRSSDVMLLSLRPIYDTGLDTERTYGGWQLVDVSSGSAQLGFDDRCLWFDTVESFNGIKSNVVILVLDKLTGDADIWQSYQGMLRARVDLIVLAHNSWEEELAYVNTLGV